MSIPQGSCLGPLLVLIYINDLQQAVRGSTVSMYADNTSLCHESHDHDMTQLKKAIYKDLKNLSNRLQDSKLSLNVPKTNSMLVTTKQKCNSLKGTNLNLELKIQESRTDVAQRAKYFGVQINSHLDWKDQIKAISAQVSKAIGILKHAKTFPPSETLKILYTGIVEPSFRYYCSVWGCFGSTEKPFAEA